jgi:hypothetical protein
MSVAEAVGLVLTAAKSGQGGDIFVLDMGKTVKILTVGKKGREQLRRDMGERLVGHVDLGCPIADGVGLPFHRVPIEVDEHSENGVTPLGHGRSRGSRNLPTEMGFRAWQNACAAGEWRSTAGKAGRA